MAEGPGHDIIVIGASLGGVEAIRNLVANLPRDLPAAVFVVQHVSPEAPGLFAQVLGRVSRLTVGMAVDAEPIEYGRVYVAPPDRHLLLVPDRVRVVYGPRENHWRPAIDPLFRSAAIAFQSRVAAVILTGLLNDGAAGLVAVKQCGGLAVVQDPKDAQHPEMPENALAQIEPDHCVALAQMAPLLVRLANEPAPPPPPIPDEIRRETRVMEIAMNHAGPGEAPGTPTELTCPECGGVLWQIGEEPTRYRCHVGHAYAEGTLLDSQNDGVEYALWAAVRALKERGELLARMGRTARNQNRVYAAADHEQKSQESFANAEKLRQLLKRAG
jgi:two-component system chemotaxis response regulator CheB